MNSTQLNHVLRAVDSITAIDASFLLLGSQAILAHLDPEFFDAEVLFVSQEIDVAVLSEDKAIQQQIADVIDGSLGELSRFDQEFGYYADGVSLGTATLADGWRDRLKPYEAPQIKPGKFWALSYEDLAVSKLMAGRDKDVEFVRAMCLFSHPGLQKMKSLLVSLPDSPQKDLALRRWEVMVSPVASSPPKFAR